MSFDPNNFTFWIYKFFLIITNKTVRSSLIAIRTTFKLNKIEISTVLNLFLA